MRRIHVLVLVATVLTFGCGTPPVTTGTPDVNIDVTTPSCECDVTGLQAQIEDLKANEDRVAALEEQIDMLMEQIEEFKGATEAALEANDDRIAALEEQVDIDLTTAPDGDLELVIEAITRGLCRVETGDSVNGDCQIDYANGLHQYRGFDHSIVSLRSDLDDMSSTTQTLTSDLNSANQSVIAMADGFCGLTGPYSTSCLYSVIGGHSPSLPDGWLLGVPEVSIAPSFESMTAFPVYLLTDGSENDTLVLQQSIKATDEVEFSGELIIDAMAPFGWDEMNFHYVVSLNGTEIVTTPDTSVQPGSFGRLQTTINIPPIELGSMDFLNIDIVASNQGMMGEVEAEFVMWWLDSTVKDLQTNEEVPEERIQLTSHRTGTFTFVPASRP